MLTIFGVSVVLFFLESVCLPESKKGKFLRRNLQCLDVHGAQGVRTTLEREWGHWGGGAIFGKGINTKTRLNWRK